MSHSAIALICMFGIVGVAALASRRRTLPRPPGPPAWPVIGNLLRFPRRDMWHKLTSMENNMGAIMLDDILWLLPSLMLFKPGPLTFFHGLGYSVLFLNNIESINALLVKRSRVYSNRPYFTVAGDMMGLNSVSEMLIVLRLRNWLDIWSQSFALMSYSKTWLLHRRLARFALNNEANKKYYTIQEQVARTMCQSLIDDPANPAESVRVYLSSIMKGRC